MSDPKSAKKLARAALRSRLGTLSAGEAADLSRQIVARIEAEPAFNAAGVVLMFVPMASRPEVDLRPLAARALKLGKVVALPRVDWPARTMTARAVANLDSDLEPDTGNAAAGLMQPRESCPVVRPELLDLLLVPGLGFDDTGGRIGHGAGFYDRFLAQSGANGGHGLVCGVGFEVQVLPPGQRLPLDPHDRPMQMLVTESRVLRFVGSGPAGHAAPG